MDRVGNKCFALIVMLVTAMAPTYANADRVTLKILPAPIPQESVILPDDVCADKVPVKQKGAVKDLSLNIFNIDFGVWEGTASTKIGAAAVGNTNDYWNSVTRAWTDDHTAKGLKTAQKESTPIEVRSINLGGGWGNDSKMGVVDAMYNDYNYPQNNQGGDSEVILRKVPEGTYDLYVYGHHVMANGYGDYEVYAGGKKLGRKNTSKEMDAIVNSCWVEGSQYVRFTDISIKNGETLNIVIYPSGKGTRSWSDTIINGLQLVPAGTPRIEYR